MNVAAALVDDVVAVVDGSSESLISQRDIVKFVFTHIARKVNVKRSAASGISPDSLHGIAFRERDLVLPADIGSKNGPASGETEINSRTVSEGQFIRIK